MFIFLKFMTNSNIFKKSGLAFMPFWIAGFPYKEQSIETMMSLLKYADVLEVGIPFSDPIADGVVIQQASKTAIEAGFKTSDVFEIITKANHNFKKPIVILCYLNTILQYGVESFVKQASLSGVKTLLVVDLPPEEIDIIKKHCDFYNLSISLIITTNTSIERVKFIDSICNSFLYFVSKPSVTGGREELVCEKTLNYINLVKQFVQNPVYVGFGISNKSQVLEYSKTKVDGFIVGSKLISLRYNDKIESFLSKELLS